MEDLVEHDIKPLGENLWYPNRPADQSMVDLDRWGKEERFRYIQDYYRGPISGSYPPFLGNFLINASLIKVLEGMVDDLDPDPGRGPWHGPEAPAKDETEVMQLVSDEIEGYDGFLPIERALQAIHDAGWKLVRNV